MGWILWLSMALDRFFASTYTKIFWDEVIRLAEVITLNDWVIRIKKAIANVADLDVERQAGGELDTLDAYHFCPCPRIPHDTCMVPYHTCRLRRACSDVRNALDHVDDIELIRRCSCHQEP